MEKKDSNKLNILVVDDKKIIGDLFDFTLGYGGHHITVVSGGNAAIEEVKKKDFDIVFLDIVMPEKDGCKVLEEMKRLKPALPIVMMSGFSVEEKRCEAKDLGAVTCLKKPFDLEDVRKVIKMAIGRDI